MNSPTEVLSCVQLRPLRRILTHYRGIHNYWTLKCINFICFVDFFRRFFTSLTQRLCWPLCSCCWKTYIVAMQLWLLLLKTILFIFSPVVSSFHFRGKPNVAYSLSKCCSMKLWQSKMMQPRRFRLLPRCEMWSRERWNYEVKNISTTFP